LQRLERGILNHDPALEVPAGVSQAAPARGSRRPGQLRSVDATIVSVGGPLVGRAQELRELMLVLRGLTRLVTITRTGGTGKTRLALEVAARLVALAEQANLTTDAEGPMDPPRRDGAAAPDRAGVSARLVAGWPQDRLRGAPRGPERPGRRGRGWLPSTVRDRHRRRGRGRPGLVAGWEAACLWARTARRLVEGDHREPSRRVARTDRRESSAWQPRHSGGVFTPAWRPAVALPARKHTPCFK
jgi:hypothetical protein